SARRLVRLARSSAFSSASPPVRDVRTLSLHDALPIFRCGGGALGNASRRFAHLPLRRGDCLASFLLRLVRDLLGPAGDAAGERRDRKSTRLNSSHVKISYAVLCLRKRSCAAE